jgi:hypothetical protein
VYDPRDCYRFASFLSTIIRHKRFTFSSIVYITYYSSRLLLLREYVRDLLSSVLTSPFSLRLELIITMITVENSQIDGSMDVDQPNPSENENSAKDPTDMDTNDTNNDVNKKTGSALRRQSLLLAAFPWFSSIIMTPKKLSEELGINHYAYVCLYILSLFFNSSADLLAIRTINGRV